MGPLFTAVIIAQPAGAALHGLADGPGRRRTSFHLPLRAERSGEGTAPEALPTAGPPRRRNRMGGAEPGTGREAMNGWTETGRAVVYPWHCDHLGHMNVQHYVGMFDIGAFHFLSMLGFGSHDMHDKGATLVDAQHTIRFIKEQSPGSLVKIESAITRIGTKSLNIRHRMINTETGDLAATTEIVMVYFDLATRKSIPLTEALKEGMSPYLADPDGLD